jgi:hypothetical protein
MKVLTLMITLPRIAHPKAALSTFDKVAPSILKIPASKLELSQATRSSMAPFITTEIKPKVRMYRGNASTLTTGATMAVTNPKIMPTNR